MRTVDVSVQLDELRAEADFEPDTLVLAEDLLLQASMLINAGVSQLGSLVLDICYRAWTTAIPTFAVALASDGFPILMLNPNFAVDLAAPKRTSRGQASQVTPGSGPAQDLDPSGLVFVLLHEASHLLFKHLIRTDLAGNSGIIASEATINYFVHGLLKNSGRPGAWRESTRWLPTYPKARDLGARIPPGPRKRRARARIGVDPWLVWREYRDALTQAGMVPLPLEDFYASDAECLRQLERLPQPPEGSRSPCLHTGPGTDEALHSTGAGTGSGAPAGKDPPGVDLVVIDQLATDDAIGEVLTRAIALSLRGHADPALRSELLRLAEATPQAVDRWRDLGLASLKGEPTSTRRVDWWLQWLHTQLASRLMESDRLVWDRSITWETRLAYVGDDEKFHLLIALDTSGSIPDVVLESFIDLVGTSDAFDAHWICFDHRALPFTPGDPLVGRGGTDFTVIDDYAAELEEPPDAVIVLTDGYAAPLLPREPDRWIWLILPGGNPWPASQSPPMSCIEIPLPDRRSM